MAAAHAITEETAIVRRALYEKDETAFAQLMELKMNYVRTIVRRTTNNFPNDMEDGMQEVWLRLWKSGHQCKNEQSFKPWLRTASRRAALDVIRSAKRHRLDSIDCILYQPASQEHVLRTTEILYDHLILTAQESFAHIPSTYQQSFLFEYALRVHLKEEGAITNTPVNTVKVYRMRARTEMQKQMRERLPAELQNYDFDQVMADAMQQKPMTAPRGP